VFSKKSLYLCRKLKNMRIKEYEKKIYLMGTGTAEGNTVRGKGCRPAHSKERMFLEGYKGLVIKNGKKVVVK